MVLRRTRKVVTMKIVEEGSGDVLPTVELEVEGVSVNKWLKELMR